MSNMHSVQVVAVTGGKGGVGKTNLSINLSLALAEAGKRYRKAAIGGKADAKAAL